MNIIEILIIYNKKLNLLNLLNILNLFNKKKRKQIVFLSFILFQEKLTLTIISISDVGYTF